MLKIQIDVTPIRGQMSGVGYYAYNLVQGLFQLQQTEDFQLGLYFHPSLKKWLKRDFTPSPLLQKDYPLKMIPLPVTFIHLISQFPNPIIPYFEQTLDHPDIVQGTDHFVYPCCNSLRVMTIHDLTFIKYPNYTTNIVKTYRSRIENCLRWTDLMITFAESTKEDIVKYLGFPEDQIKITPQASRYSCLAQKEINHELLTTQNLYDFNHPYLLFVSTLEPRKNLITLIEAFNYLKEKYKIEHHLILIGQKGWKYQSILESIHHSPYQDQIHHLNYLSDELVALFYQKAEVFVYPSSYEGFGLPVLEAMTLGAPVITSNTASLPEVAGDAAILIDPNQMLELAEAILQVISHSSLRDNLIQKGQERAKQFSWEKTAQKTLDAYLS